MSGCEPVQCAAGGPEDFLSSNVLVDPKYLGSGDVYKAAGSRDHFKADRLERLEFKYIGALPRRFTLSCNSRIDLEIPDQVVSKHGEFLMGRVSGVLASWHCIEAELTFEFGDLMLHGASAVVKLHQILWPQALVRV